MSWFLCSWFLFNHKQTSRDNTSVNLFCAHPVYFFPLSLIDDPRVMNLKYTFHPISVSTKSSTQHLGTWNLHCFLVCILNKNIRIFSFVLIIFHTSDQYSQSYILHREVFMYAPVCHNNNLPYSCNILAFRAVGWKNWCPCWPCVMCKVQLPISLI